MTRWGVKRFARSLSGSSWPFPSHGDGVDATGAPRPRGDNGWRSELQQRARTAAGCCTQRHLLHPGEEALLEARSFLA